MRKFEDTKLLITTWLDLRFITAFNALFLKGPSLIHLSRHIYHQSYWNEIKVSKSELNKINEFIQQSFRTDANGDKILLKGEGYYNNDDFYKAYVSLSCFKTFNAWVNL